MTNTEIIQAIRNEIERLKTIQLKRIQEGDLVDAEPYDKNEAYNELLDFLTTLEPEKPMNLEEEISRYLREECSGDDEPSISEIARHFAQWGADHTPLPEDTVLFSKGVEEGKRLMMEEAVEYEVWDFSVEAYPHVNIPLDNKHYRNGDKVRVIVLKKED